MASNRILEKTFSEDQQLHNNGERTEMWASETGTPCLDLPPEAVDSGEVTTVWASINKVNGNTPPHPTPSEYKHEGRKSHVVKEHGREQRCLISSSYYRKLNPHLLGTCHALVITQGGRSNPHLTPNTTGQCYLGHCGKGEMETPRPLWMQRTGCFLILLKWL